MGHEGFACRLVGRNLRLLGIQLGGGLAEGFFRCSSFFCQDFKSTIL